MLINQALIYTEKHTVEKPKGIVIISHGIALHSIYYRKLAELLNGGGYSVVLYDLRGHGKSQGKRGDIKSYKHFLDDLNAIIIETKKDSNLPIYILGHSMGGVITNVYASLYSNFDGVILLATPTQTPSMGLLSIIPYNLFGFLRIKTDFSDDRLSHFPPSDNVDPYALKSFTLRLIGNVLKTAMKTLKSNLGNYKHSILIIHGTEDKLVPYKDSEKFYQQIPSKDKTLKLITDGYHNLNHDTVTEEVSREIITWLDKKNAKN